MRHRFCSCAMLHNAALAALGMLTGNSQMPVFHEQPVVQQHVQMSLCAGNMTDTWRCMGAASAANKLISIG